MEVGFRPLGSFFDTEKVKRQMDRKTHRALSKFGAFVWRRVRSSLKYRKSASAPGSPPSVHKNTNFSRVKKSKKGVETKQVVSPFRELRQFAWDENTRSVVVGPVIFKRSNMIPKLHAFGGSVQTRQGRKTYPPRPTESLALKAELPKFTGLFRG